jgi:hypothetical protein
VDSGPAMFALGVVAGIALTLVAIGLRRLRTAESTTLPQGAQAPAQPRPNALVTAPRSPIADIDRSEPVSFVGVGGLPGNTRVTRQVSRTQIRLTGGDPTVTVDGVTYRSLAEVPEPTRDLLVDEVKLALSKDLPATARTKLEAFLAAGGEPTGKPPRDP